MALDQHLMIDKELIKKIVKTTNIEPTDIILEIGPGTGNLTKEIIKKTKKLILIEKDNKFLKILKTQFPKTKIIIENALESELPTFTKLISNLPYNICEPLIWKLTKIKFKTAILTTPKIFAERLNKNTKLGLLTNSFFNVEIIETINKSSFKPQPKIKSVLIKLTKHNKKSTLKTVFLQRDKKIKNILINILTKKGLTKNQARTKIMFIPPSILENKIQKLSESKFKIIKKVINIKYL